MPTTLYRALVALLLGTALSGCAMFNEGTGSYTRTTTLGQELIDLKAAKDQNAISEEEFIEIKAKIIKAGAFDPALMLDKKK